MTDQPQQEMDRRRSPGRRARDLAAILPVLALLLYFTPITTAFAGAGSLWGVPVIFLFLFGSWLILIAVLAIIAPYLVDELDP